ncbi:MAG: mechanosensitive ion channel family protein [Meiothermus sp.]|uniref:mechanosensitive ion channel family protein n=1 Tax=Meiothermus sp. TaxID=1955249 RepID=UPI0025EB8CED|nr:mechanosensitive ion channel family protein [Meiothermus sp.]MCS7057623.1 mechanosensitive ion channel family protein [Meiothermus sp.]MCS7193975.1 mechanosensitive ion channel family protein [Meiothermus sp.]MCX7741030.1 mechanosensitive ion channel family protein [Meiothermus sp.]MDW8090739.1 mechanosensitive ion channel family protein [Meiothermus sp.]MDW8480835.1 mechanosensitive ion channel family protein [Meiothermus sp.]
MEDAGLWLRLLLSAALLGVGFWVARGGARFFGWLARFTPDARDDRYWRLLGGLWWVLVGLAVFSLLSHAWKVPLEPFGTWGRTLFGWLGERGLAVLLILGITSLALRLVPRLLQRVPVGSGEFTREQVRAQTLKSVLESVLQVLIVVLGGLLLLSNLGLNVTALLAGAGVVGLGISLAAQNLIRDVINGFFILLEDQYGVGDVITVGQFAGTVERFNLRLTVLRDLEGRVHFLPNSTIQQVTVMSRDWARAVVDVSVAYEAPVDKALEAVREEALAFYHDPEWRPRFTDQPPEMLGVQQLAESGVVIRVMFTTKPKEQWAVGREFRRRIKLRLDAEGIPIPYPTRRVVQG